jgi:hypothetical protein
LALLAAAGLLSLGLFTPPALKGQVNPASSTETFALNPQRMLITLTDRFEFSQSATSFDRAVKHIQFQIDSRREAELEKASMPGAFWHARLWDFLPAGQGTMNSPVTRGDNDDPFFTPPYLSVPDMMVERQLAKPGGRIRIFMSQ